MYTLGKQEEPEIKVKHAIEGSRYRATETWEELNLKQELLDGLYKEMEFKNPSKIQVLYYTMGFDSK